MSDLPEKDNNLNENTENIDREEDGASTVFSDPVDHKKTAARKKRPLLPIIISAVLAVAVLAGGTVAVINLLGQVNVENVDNPFTTVDGLLKKIDADYIIKEVEKHFKLKNETIVSSKRDKMYSYPIQIAMYICRELTQLSLPEIGKEFGGRNHATVLHNINKIKEEMENDLNVMNNVNELIKNIANNED